MNVCVTEKSRVNWWKWAIVLQTPYDDDSWVDDPHNVLHLAGFGWSIWVRIPVIIKPVEKWVDTTALMQSIDKKSPAGPRGYTQYIRREYGFVTYDSDLQVRYGIQPDCWSRNDPDNSDHVKVFFYPWNHYIVRSDILTPSGDLYHRNTYKRGKVVGVEIRSHELKEQLKHSEYVAVSQQRKLTHYTKDGRKQEAVIDLVGVEREWRRFGLYFSWWPFGKIVTRTVECSSDTELGARAGSWKGGMLGWSCDWNKGETMKGAFYRWYRDWDGR